MLAVTLLLTHSLSLSPLTSTINQDHHHHRQQQQHCYCSLIEHYLTCNCRYQYNLPINVRVCARTTNFYAHILYTMHLEIYRSVSNQIRPFYSERVEEVGNGLNECVATLGEGVDTTTTKIGQH